MLVKLDQLDVEQRAILAGNVANAIGVRLDEAIL